MEKPDAKKVNLFSGDEVKRKNSKRNAIDKVLYTQYNNIVI